MKKIAVAVSVMVIFMPILAASASAMELPEAELEILRQIANLEELPPSPTPIILELGEEIIKNYTLNQGDVILAGLEITGGGVNLHMIVWQNQMIVYNKNWGYLPARLTLEVYLHGLTPRDTADIIEWVAARREITFTFSRRIVIYDCYPPEEGAPQNLTITGRLLVTDVQM